MKKIVSFVLCYAMIQCHLDTTKHHHTRAAGIRPSEPELLRVLNNPFLGAAKGLSMPFLPKRASNDYSEPRWLTLNSNKIPKVSRQTAEKSSDPNSNFLKDNLSKAADFYKDFMNYLPKQIGVEYNDAADNIDSAVGNTLLAYGAYDKHSRKQSFRMLKQKLMKGLEERKSMIEARMSEIHSLNFVIEKMNGNERMITSYQNMLDDKMNSEIQEHLNSAL